MTQQDEVQATQAADQTTDQAEQETVSREIVFSWKGTTNTNTIEAWKTNGVPYSEEVKTGKDKDGNPVQSKQFRRDDLAITADIPTVTSLVQTDAGKNLLSQLLLKTVSNYLFPFADQYKLDDIAEAEITAEKLLKFIAEKPKASKLTATKEEMAEAAEVFKQALESTGKTGQAVTTQVGLFEAKFATGKINKFADTYYTRGATREKVVELLGKILDNLNNFKVILESEEQEQEVRDACMVPTLICIQNIENWIQGVEEVDEDDVPDLEDF